MFGTILRRVEDSSYSRLRLVLISFAAWTTVGVVFAMPRFASACGMVVRVALIVGRLVGMGPAGPDDYRD